jgi:hypothetical protein
VTNGSSWTVESDEEEEEDSDEDEWADTPATNNNTDASANKGFVEAMLVTIVRALISKDHLAHDIFTFCFVFSIAVLGASWYAGTRQEGPSTYLPTFLY